MADFNNTESSFLLTGTNEADSVYNSSLASNVTIETYEGNDSIQNYGSYVTVNAGEGNDSIHNGGYSQGYDNGIYSYITGGDGDDTIWNNARYVTIDAGAGNDSIYSDIYPSPYEHVTIYGGDGNDTLVVNDHSCSLNGGAGDDYISIQSGTRWNGNTLEGGTGNDTLYGGGNNVFFYQEGDGNDIVFNYTLSDKIQINSNTPYSSVQSGEDVLITIGDGSMLLKNSTLVEVEVYYGDDVVFSDVNVDLNDVGESETGVFVVNEVTNSDGTVSITSAATFKAASEDGDIVVGNVTEPNVYVAEAESEYRQNITIPENWQVTGTNNDDILNFTGNNATASGIAGSDRFYVASDVTNATFADFTPSEDSLSFASTIPEQSLHQSMIEEALALSNDDINLTFQNTPSLTDELLSTEVNNGGVTNTISELIEGSAPSTDTGGGNAPPTDTGGGNAPPTDISEDSVSPADTSRFVINASAPIIMSLSHWSYGFTPSE